MRSKALITTVEEAIAAIPNGATIAVGGFVGAGHPEMLTAALERRFLQEGSPRDLTLFYCAGQGDRGERGLNHLAHPGLLHRVIGGHWNLAPKLGALALANEIEAYNFPQGVLSVLLREIAAKRPGVFTKVGLNTFLDPVNGGGRLNARTTQDLVERIEIDGEIWLRYVALPIHVGLIRATSADGKGNLTMEREGLIGEVLPIAQAAKNHGGIVIAQVERIVDRIEDPKSVRVPGMLVDYLVVSEGKEHDQTFSEAFNSSYVTTGHDGSAVPPIGFSERQIIGARALREVRCGDIVNLGIGLPETVASVAAQTGRLGEFTLTVESGPIGGVPASGLSFGCSHFPEAIIDQPAQFDFYDGGGLDLAVLGAVEIDAEGSVNVTSFAGRFAGVGGFMNITQSARRLIFCCTFRAGEIEVAREGGNLRIVREGRHPKFVKTLQDVCFHGPSAIAAGREVLYVTERAVFELRAEGLRLIELAPGIDLQRDVLDQMEFLPNIADSLKPLTLPEIS
ncbi:MAG: malonate decarboxylase subunit alpha [Verrucomicrobiales bacterium]|nr:malonate decarboxylase subunit alpha [Verrucomicrobiales bacterium]HQZ28667.1 malonate decarboxylase subunit alpha [Verrucomicrobiales bacterium]